MRKLKEEVRPVSRVGITFARKLGVYRASFLTGRSLAPRRDIRARGIDVAPDGYLYTGYLKQVNAASNHWISQNKE